MKTKIPEILKLYEQFIEELDAYENDPKRSRFGFWQRDESFEGFIAWLRYGLFFKPNLDK